jgi:Ca-activated chloride channel family protein
MNLSAFHFLRPYVLLALPPLGLLLLLLARRQGKHNPWRSVCDPQLLSHIMTACGARRRWPWTAAALGAVLSVLALAGPTWKRLPQPAYLNQSGLLIVFDLNASMNAADLKPSRLACARYKIADILHSRHEGQTGLVVYAGDAFTVTPMTDDTNTIYSQLSVLDTSLMPSQGDRADLAVAKAASLLRQDGLRRGDVLLVADGVDAARLKPAIRKLRAAGYRLSVLGVGTAQGAPVPLGTGGFQLDAHGAVALSRLQGRTLRAMAALGDGMYRQITPSDKDIHALQAEFARHWRPGSSKRTSVNVDIWREEGPWLLLPVLLLAAFAFRRGMVFGLLLFLFFVPQPARAMSWTSLWSNRNQQGSQALKRGHPRKAARLFVNGRWKAAAFYRAGDYAQALKALKGCRGKADWYNRGNALARLGRYRQAVQAYQEALNRDPDFKDARFNQRLVEKLLKDRQKNTSGKSSRNGRSSPLKKPDAKDVKGQQKGRKGGGTGGLSQNPPHEKKGASGTSQAQKGSGAKPTSQAAPHLKPGSPTSGSGRQKSSLNPAAPQPANASSSAKVPAGRTGSKGQSPPPVDVATAGEPGGEQNREKQQSSRQWLRQVPDDPGGLLRRKFYYEYHQRHPDSDQGEQPW